MGLFGSVFGGLNDGRPGMFSQLDGSNELERLLQGLTGSQPRPTAPPAAAGDTAPGVASTGDILDMIGIKPMAGAPQVPGAPAQPAAPPPAPAPAPPQAGAFGSQAPAKIKPNFFDYLVHGPDAGRIIRAQEAKIQAGQDIGQLLAGPPAGGAPGAPGAPGGAAPAAGGGLSINDPRLARLAFMAKQAGYDLSDVLDVLKAQQPHVVVGPDGSTYNDKDPAALNRRFANRTNVNGNIVDLNDPSNEDTFYGDAPVRGAVPLKDPAGNIVDWMLPNGARASIGQAAQAETQGRTNATVFNRPNGDGSTTPTLGRDMFGGPGGAGPGRTQTPADATYQGENAKFGAEQFKGIQTAGTRASSMISTYDRMGQLLDGFQTGKFTPAGKEIVSALSSLGIKPDPRWGNVEAADAISKKLALDAMGGSLGAGFSNADRDFVTSMNPSIAQTPQGRAQIIAFGKAKAQREVQIASMARAWQSKAGRLDAPDRNGKTFWDYLDAYAAANPLMGNRR